MASALNDELLAALIAAGQADVLVGLATQNDAATVGPVVRAVLAACAGPLVRERAVLLNLDVGSSDGTRELIATLAPSPEEASQGYALRSLHRITVTDPEFTERRAALRTLFTVADLLQAKSVLVLDPGASHLGAADVAHFVRAVTARQADYVKPRVPRAPGEGPLVTQLVRPLLRALYGVELSEPADTQFACSARFAAELLASAVWLSPGADLGIDVLLSAHALGSGRAILEVASAAHGFSTALRARGASEVFAQVAGAALFASGRDLAGTLAVRGSRRPELEGTPPAPGPPSSARFDLVAFGDAFRLGIDALSPLLGQVLGGELLAELAGRAEPGAAPIDDALWARTVFAFVLACKEQPASATRLAQMLEPLYLGRVASSLGLPPGAVANTDPLEALALAFEAEKNALAARLTPDKEH